MFVMNATDARKDWSLVVDQVVREKPTFIKRTRDLMVLSNLSLFESMLTPYTFTAQEYTEKDGSITLSLNEIDLIENGKTEDEVKLSMARAIQEYAEDYYNNFALWSAAPNRKSHIPYVLKALILEDAKKIGDLIKCQAGKN
ncbi:MAG: hypothetical protein Q8865_07805 [Bacillota bacterium]|nr:hypothetical protein [Bacillota bacterium]